ncbi:MAG: M48 family metallopeptidase [Burkholderiales bacterium]|nr:M48 family metallopeptidase [Burkholderiales bacterium]
MAGGDESSAVVAALSHEPLQRPEMSAFRHPQAEREVRLGDIIVAYEFQRVRRRSIGMVVSADGLSVRAPRWVSSGDIETALHAKSRWICNKLVEQRERALKQKASRIEWREGGSLAYLGEPLILVLEPQIKGATVHEGLPTLPGMAQRALHLGLPQGSAAEVIGDAVQAWLKKQARRCFESRVQHFAAQMGVQVTRVGLSSARTRWGSASVDGSIRLHWRLMHFSDQVIDYVVVHELAHLHEMNHSPRFWAVVRSVMPDFEEAREQLRHAVIPEWA